MTELYSWLEEKLSSYCQIERWFVLKLTKIISTVRCSNRLQVISNIDAPHDYAHKKPAADSISHPLYPIFDVPFPIITNFDHSVVMYLKTAIVLHTQRAKFLIKQKYYFHKFYLAEP